MHVRCTQPTRRGYYIYLGCHVSSFSVISNHELNLSCPASTCLDEGQGCCFQALYGQMMPPLISRSVNVSHLSSTVQSCCCFWARWGPCHRKISPLGSPAGKQIRGWDLFLQQFPSDFLGFVYGFMTRHVEHVYIKGGFLFLTTAFVSMLVDTREYSMFVLAFLNGHVYFKLFSSPFKKLEQMECFFFNFKSQNKRFKAQLI